MKRLPALYARLIRACQRRGRTLEDSEDLVQEAYLRLLEYRRSSEILDQGTFLARIVHNLTINLYRREQILAFALEPIEEFDEQALFTDRSPGPERIFEARQQLEGIVDMLSTASRRTCEVFFSYYLGYTHHEIASRLGISRRTVQKHLARANLLLRIMLDKQLLRAS